MALAVLLWCNAALLATSLGAVAGGGRASTTRMVYLIALIASAAALAAGIGCLVTGAGLPQALRLPLGLPWLGTHFRLDPLSAAFLVVVNLGASTASLYGLGYGPH